MARVGSHPNVVPLLGVVLRPPSVYALVLPFYKRGSLLNALGTVPLADAAAPNSASAPGIATAPAPSTPLGSLPSVPQKLRWARDAAAGVAHLHAEHVVHRDIALRNMLLTDAGATVVADFGMSREVELEDAGGNTLSTVGPIKWMAPECIARRHYSQRSDTYSFGVFLYELFVGEEPYPGLPLMTIVSEVLMGTLRPELPPLFDAELGDPRVGALMRRCWLTEPDARPDMMEILRVLSDVIADCRLPTSLTPSSGASSSLSSSLTESGWVGGSDSVPLDSSLEFDLGAAAAPPSPATQRRVAQQKQRASRSQRVDPFTKLVGISATALACSELLFAALVRCLRDSYRGVSVRDRKYHLKTYRACFIASELVDWLIANRACSLRQEAVEIGALLVARGAILHVTDIDKAFSDAMLFFRFSVRLRVAVIGSGASAVAAAFQLSHGCDTTMFCTESVYVPPPLYASFLTAGTNRRAPVDLVRHLSRVLLVQSRVAELRASEVVTADGIVRAFDRLIICAPFSCVIDCDIPGTNVHYCPLSGAVLHREYVLENMADLVAAAAVVPRAYGVAVVGCGPDEVELSVRLAEALKVPVYLVCDARIVPGYGPAVYAAVCKALARVPRLELRENDHVQFDAGSGLTLSSGSEFVCECVLRLHEPWRVDDVLEAWLPEGAVSAAGVVTTGGDFLVRASDGVHAIGPHMATSAQPRTIRTQCHEAARVARVLQSDLRLPAPFAAAASADDGPLTMYIGNQSILTQVSSDKVKIQPERSGSLSDSAVFLLSGLIP
jgi:serine/threonine protein kinase